MITRFEEHGVDVYDAELNLVHTFPLERDRETHGFSVTHSRDRLAHTTGEAVACVGADGRELWRFEIGRLEGIARAGVAFSADDSRLWLYVPNVMGGRDEADQWIVLDAATGAPLARHDLPTTGQGCSHLALPDGRMLLDVGEGQHGTRCFIAAPETPVTRIDAWENRVPIDLSPDRWLVMTVDHEQEHVAFHDVIDFATRLTIPLSDFGAGELGEAGIEWTGGFLTAETAIVVVSGEDEETGEMWWKHFTVDTRTGEVTGELGISTIDEYDLRPLGDGTYVITDTDGSLSRM